MALSEAGLYAAGVMPGPMIYGPNGSRKVIRPKAGPAKAGRRSFYVKPKSSRRGGGR